MCHYEHIYSQRPGQNRSSSVQSVRDPQSAPERSCELADHPQTTTHCLCHLQSSFRQSRGRGPREKSTCSSPHAGPTLRHHRRHSPVDRIRTDTRHSQVMAAGVSRAASPAAVEGAPPAAVEDAAAELLSEARARAQVASSRAGCVRGVHVPTRPTRLVDVVSRATRGGNCSVT